jgi:hypothetical protein
MNKDELVEKLAYGYSSNRKDCILAYTCSIDIMLAKVESGEMSWEEFLAWLNNSSVVHTLALGVAKTIKQRKLH